MIDIDLLYERIDEVTLLGEEVDLRVRIPARPEGPRKYLGLSGLGDSCLRKVWLGWRQTYTPTHPPRLLRLFQRGDREEFVFVDLLRKSGFKVFETDENGEQFKVSEFDGHLSGHLDGVAVPPADLWKGGEPKPVLLEFKTYNDKRFNELLKVRVAKNDPKYYVQMQGYMGLMELSGALFCAVNKNDDRIYFEWVPFNKHSFDALLNRAEEILTSVTPPKKLSNIPSYYECKWCDAFKVCHGGEPALISCRSCAFSEPSENASWTCSKGRTFGEVCDLYKDISKG
jgi:hypothetical protein